MLHGWYRNPSKTNWKPEQIREEHTRVVRIIKDRGWTHTWLGDALDRTLPKDLQDWSKAQKEKK